MAARKLRGGIHIPALVEHGQVIVPEVWIDECMEVETKRIPLDKSTLTYPEMYGEDPHYLQYLTAAEYLRLHPPTLAELRRAFFDKNPDGSYIAPEYRNSKYRGFNCSSQRMEGVGHAEWTATFLVNRSRAIELPEKVFYDREKKEWVIEGGKVTNIELPPDGYVVEYDGATGLATRTSQNREDAENVFGNDAPSFGVSRVGLVALLVSHGLFGSGLFDICGASPETYAICVKPDFDDRELEQITYRYIGARSCQRIK